ncbi:ATP-binding protein [Mycobacterium sp. pW049]|uniref:ATP-binding protein n=1 Tax=[Mycobacterium] bulgaricum TaxID=3238985 RepID=UPI00351B542C
MNPDKRPSRWSPSNWPVRAKVLAIVAVPLILACIFGGLRISTSTSEALDLRRAADRADMVPAVVDYMAGLEAAMQTATDGGDAGAAMTQFDSDKSELQHLLGVTEVDDSVRLATNTLIDLGQSLVDKIAADSVDLRARVMAYAPLLITAETAITGLVGDDAAVRAEGAALSRAVGARGQMAMQRMLVDKGGELPEPVLRSAIVTIAGTEPATVSAIGAFLGGASDQAASLRSEMVKRLSVISDPASVLVGNAELLASQQVTADIADDVIARTADAIPATVTQQADDARAAAIRDAALVGAGILVALILVGLVARSLVRPLRTLRDSALKVAHEDLAREVEHVRADGKEFPVQPIPVHTTEEVGQVAHAVDELHQQAIMLAGEQARLQLQVTDMFETLSRRNRSLVDQQLSLIDQLERDEEDPGRLESLFRLDHLAARMRRNGANLMVLAGAQMSREQAASVPVAALVNAAASEVEEYTRVVTVSLPDSEIDGAVAGDLVHLLAELLDNALRYSPPSTQVQVSAVPTGNNGLVIEVSDTGLGMTEADLRVANTRLESGGEVNPYTARHMGLFVVGRLAAQHGLVARLRSTVAAQADSGTTAGVYIPSRLLVHTRPVAHGGTDAQTPADAHAGLVTALALEGARPSEPALPPEPAARADDVLPQRRPGANGIVEPPPAPEPVEAEPRPSVASFFTARPQPQAPPQPEPRRAGHAALDDDEDAIYQKMLSEWLVDPHELSQSSDLNWKSVWDNGWSAAAAAEAAPVRDRTAEGLPVRQPGARLVPGHAEERPVASADEPENGHAGPVRDPDAVRASIGGHFGGVHAGRRRAQEAGGTDHQ